MARVIQSFVVKHEEGEDWGEQAAREERALANLVAELKEGSEDAIVGEEIRWQRADGYARYVVAKTRPLQLIHLGVGDGWQVEEALIRGLSLDDVKEMVERQKALADLWANRGAGDAD